MRGAVAAALGPDHHADPHGRLLEVCSLSWVLDGATAVTAPVLGGGQLAYFRHHGVQRRAGREDGGGGACWCRRATSAAGIVPPTITAMSP
ncbi:hypothetical protein ACU686_27400 [Yinghuangia aomiensis]